MKTIKYFVAFVAIATLSVSCSKKNIFEEALNPAPQKPNITVGTPIIMAPSVGGPNQPNQVFIDLSQHKEYTVKRDSWSLGFNNGEGFNVVLNYTNYTTAAEVNATDIDKVKEADLAEIKAGLSGHMGSPEFVDDPSGDLTKTTIKPINAKAEENKVYLLYLGNSVPTERPKAGSANVHGSPLGYKKVRVLRKDNGYLLQYANLDQATHKEVFIPKGDKNFSFTYFDLVTEKVVKVEPKKNNWDLCFTVFTNKTTTDDGSQSYSYSYSDFIATNFFGGVKIFTMLSKGDKELSAPLKQLESKGLLKQNSYLTYEKFTTETLISYEKKLKPARTLPGSIWRSVFSGKVNTDLFFLIQDPAGHIYKMRIYQMLNDKGERGYPEFEYQLL